MIFKPVNPRASTLLRAIIVGMVLITLVPVFLLGRVMLGRADLSYELTGRDLIIHFGATDQTIPRADVTGVQVFGRLTAGSRIAGTAMPGLYEGRWSFRETGRIRLYASTRENLVVLETPDGKLGLTPAEAAAFVDALKSGATGSWAPAEGGNPWLFFGPFLAFLVIAMGAALGILIYYVRLPMSIRYTVADDALLIEGGRLRVALPYGQIERIQIASPAGIPWRKFGAHLPGLVWGNFSWRGLPSPLRIYATQQKPLVLIAAGGITYGISPAEPERLITEVQQRLRTI